MPRRRYTRRRPRAGLRRRPRGGRFNHRAANRMARRAVRHGGRFLARRMGGPVGGFLARYGQRRPMFVRGLSRYGARRRRR